MITTKVATLRKLNVVFLPKYYVKPAMYKLRSVNVFKITLYKLRKNNVKLRLFALR